jgi:N-acyl-D-amino-acid deacylase
MPSWSIMDRAFDRMFLMQESPVYEPDPAHSVAAEAARRGVSPEEAIYDMLTEGDGARMFLVALANFPDMTLDRVGAAMKLKHVVPGLGDGGAHYGMICDAAYPTFMLQHWVRDRNGDRLPLQRAIRLLTGASADALGLTDRGRLQVGKKADINVIDLEAIALHVPQVVRDLPAGGSRLNQLADGYVATYVAGQCIACDGNPTDARPGRLVRAGASA